MLVLTDEKLRDFAARVLGGADISVSAMPGGASTRSYYRVARGGRSAVVMFVPDSKPDEITSGETRSRWPFLEVQSLLANAGIRVPNVLHEACDDGLLAIEDLGDVTLAAHIEGAHEKREAIYRTAVIALAEAQKKLDPLPGDSVVRTRAFDHKLLKWEIEHFREWGLEARGIELSPPDRARFDAIADALALRVSQLPRSFVHRDYQSRNLMVVGPSGKEELVWIDFQDALLGPQVYDLVALLGDSYQVFTRDFIEARLDEFAEARGIPEQRKRIGFEFDLVTVQRKLKDAGRFVFIDRVKKNPDYLPYVEPTIDKVMSALALLRSEPDMRDLEALLKRVLEKKQNES